MPRYSASVLEIERLLSQLYTKNEMFEKLDLKYDESIRAQLEENLDSLNIRAVFYFLNRDIDASIKYLDKMKTQIDANKAANTSDTITVYYYNFLLQLIRKLDVDASPCDRKIYHLGESHSLTLAHHKITLDKQKHSIIPVHVVGAQAHHYSKAECNRIKSITKYNLEMIPDYSNVFISIGEIDCRPQASIIKAAFKNNIELKNLIQSTVNGYVKWFVDADSEKKHRYVFFNIPTPTYKNKYTLKENQTAAETVQLFNRFLSIALSEHSIDMVDVHGLTKGENGFSNNIYHCDDVHLDSRIIPEIEKQFNG